MVTKETINSILLCDTVYGESRKTKSLGLILL